MFNCDLVGKEFETTSFLNKLTNIDSLAMILLDCKLSHSGLIWCLISLDIDKESAEHFESGKGNVPCSEYSHVVQLN